MSNLVKPFIIAEVGNNHEGRFEIAKKEKIRVNIRTVKIFNFEKYNTLGKNYFFFCSVSLTKD